MELARKMTSDGMSLELIFHFSPHRTATGSHQDCKTHAMEGPPSPSSPCDKDEDLTPHDDVNTLLDDIKTSREQRSRQKLKALHEENARLSSSLEKAEDSIVAIQVERDKLSSENKELRDTLFDCQTRASSSADELERITSQHTDQDRHYEELRKQNAELLQLLEDEEANTAKATSQCQAIKSEAQALRDSNAKLMADSTSNRDAADTSLRQNQLQADEIRLLKAEVEQLKQRGSEASMKNAVELEALQEQLRVRKEKQYQLLKKMQQQEEARTHADDLVAGLEDKLGSIKDRASSLETQLQLEMNAKQNAEQSNQELQTEVEQLIERNKALAANQDIAEQDRMRMEAEARDNGEQLREMAEKVFQLLERLKLAELGKTRSMEALKSKEQEVSGLKKKNTCLVKEATKEAAAREKAQLDRKALDDQLRALKKQNTQLGVRCKEEAKAKIRQEDARKEAEKKVETLNSRLSFILNRLQSDEEEKGVRKEETKKIEGQLKTFSDRCDVLQQKLEAAQECNRDLTQEVATKDAELKTTKIRLDALQQSVNEQQNGDGTDEALEDKRLNVKASQDRYLAGGRMRFFIDSKPTVGQVVIKAKNAKDREWLETKGCNAFLRKAMKSSNPQEVLLQRMTEMHGAAITMEEEIESTAASVQERDDEIELLERKLHYVHSRLGAEEECKRRTLLRYINAVKASVSLGEPGCERDREEVGRIGAGRIQLPEASIGDEETHAIVSMLRDNETIAELNLRGNQLTDDAARALASLLARPSALRYVDLRENRIGRNGIKVIADALERSERVKHVYVHAGGKIEALGSSEYIGDDASTAHRRDSSQGLSSVGSVCIVDVRDNTTHEASMTRSSDGDADSNSHAGTSSSITTTSSRTGLTTKRVGSSNNSTIRNQGHSSIKKKKNSSSKARHINSNNSGIGPAEAGGGPTKVSGLSPFCIR